MKQTKRIGLLTGIAIVTIELFHFNANVAIAQTSSPEIVEQTLSPAQQQTLVEAEQLNQQVLELYAKEQYATATPLAQRVLALRENILGPNHPEVATSLNNLAELYRQQGDLSKTIPLYQRALTIYEQTLGPNHALVAVNLNNQARLYHDQDNLVQAESLYQRALTIFETSLGSEHSAVANNLTNLAELQQEQGRLDQAERLYRRALSIFNAVEPHSLAAATCLTQLALLYSRKGNYVEAQPLFLRALKTREQSLGPNHSKVLISLNNLASLYSEQGNYTEAESLLQRALAIQEETQGVSNSLVSNSLIAVSLSNLALLYFRQGDYAKAEPLNQQALAIREQHLDPNHTDIAISLNNQGLLYSGQRKYGQAEPLFQKANTILSKALGPQHPYLAINLSNLVTLSLAQGKIPRSIAFATQAANIEEHNLRQNLNRGSEARKRAYLATVAHTMDTTVSLHLQNAPRNLQAARLALTTILRRKGRVLDVLSGSHDALRQNLSSADSALVRRRNDYRSQLADLSVKDAGEISAQKQFLQFQIDQLDSQLALRSADVRQQTSALEIADIQARIPSNTALVELVLYRPLNPKEPNPQKRLGSPRYAAYLLNAHGDPKGIDLGEAEPINQASIKFRQALQSPSTDITKVARNLDQILMQPIRKQLGETHQLLLSPDSQLNLIPFAALVDEKNQYLVENYQITYLTSGRDLLRLKKNPPPPSSTQRSRFSLLIANPEFDALNAVSNNPPKAKRNTSQTPANSIQNLRFGPLVGTQKEGQALQKILLNTSLITQQDATENALKQVLWPEVLHIATHGFFLSQERWASTNQSTRGLIARLREGEEGGTIEQPFFVSQEENPLLRSGLALAGFNVRNSGNQDGVFTALEAASLNLELTKLVVLSACETGVGEVINGEGVYGLRRAFVIAGAESQVVSLWKVDDTGTKDLMVNYYKRLLNEEGRSEALHQTQLDMLQTPNYQHPYFWAAFIPSGDWRPMNWGSGFEDIVD